MEEEGAVASLQGPLVHKCIGDGDDHGHLNIHQVDKEGQLQRHY